MGANNKICPNCGRKMKQQFIGLQHCKCGMSWKKDEGFFERTPNMVFALERQTIGKKVKQIPVIRYKTDNKHKTVCYGRPFSFREGGLTYGNHKNHAASCRQGPHRKSGDQ